MTRHICVLFCTLLTLPPLPLPFFQVPDNAFEEEEGGDADLGGDDDEGLD